MDHLKEIDLIEMAGGRLRDSALLDAQRHIDLCAACSERFRQIERMNAALDVWQPVEDCRTDLLPGVLARLGNERAESSARLWLAGPLRIVAAILLSMTVGHLAARSFWHSSAEADVSVQSVESALQLATLSSRTPADLSGLFIDEFESEEVIP